MATGVADIGLIGLAVMGENLVLNIESRGFTVAVFNRSTARVDEFVNGRGKGKRFVACHDTAALCRALKAPRIVFVMVRAGNPVDAVIESVLPHLEKGDIIIDGGNSRFVDTERRTRDLESKGYLYMGCGVSGGEEGALNGPSLMPGGSTAAWPHVKPILQAIAATVPEAPGERCCDWIGSGGAGHYVKMVHNGIEYGDMQLLAEAVQVLRDVGGLTLNEIAEVMDDWNKGDLCSYLVEITASVLRAKDDRHPGGANLIDSILDCAEQKGTGKWTGQEALERGVPVSMIAEAVFARCVSSLKDERVRASKSLAGPTPAKRETVPADRAQFVARVRDAVFSAKIISYAQGFALLRTASQENGWNLRFGAIAMTWRNGCIIRSQFLSAIRRAFEANPNLENLMLDPYFAGKLSDSQAGWRQVVANAALSGVAVPAMGSALSYYDGYRSAVLPANVIQALRDYFGAHTYERVDEPRGKYFHTNWTGHGGTTTSTPADH
eukprot:m51a1_g1215 putative 6-phosphogluconate dehydrogenase (495) ;mRNA; r:486053-487730